MHDHPVITATAPNGLVLPVIDLTNPVFAVADDAGSIARMREAVTTEQRKNSRLPAFITRFLIRQAAKRSALLRAVFQSERGYLDSITTYVFKLGIAHLPPGYDSATDKRVAGSPHVTLVRLRMQQVATLLAKALEAPLAAERSAPLHLINIAGGPALDSLNTLTLLKRAHGDLLQRPIVVDVLDANAEGPAFGANALKALQQPGAPLAGLAIDFRRQTYDWNDPSALITLLARLKDAGAIVAASSEGGLFEYGEDDAIVGNLKAFAAGGVDIVAGSVTANSAMRKRMIAMAPGFKLHPRGLEGIAPLVAQGGYTVAESLDSVISHQVLLRLRR